ncbi:MAG: polysaccharide pyruvyl transferase family protein [Dysosmobacter sp.]|jgi:colanic acid/amylovoran biosynthesis protein|uniref:polysaccharide pyruvyl transferase family protein n=1 Tax=Dysosmobacter sp. TaxID=2591382 RepID=UPI003D926763
MNEILMYCHGGSGNHGCEAIVRSTIKILMQQGDFKYYLISRKPEEDQQYGLDRLATIIPEFSNVKKNGFSFLRAYWDQKVFHNHERMDTLSNLASFRIPRGQVISLSIGGDNYCYNGYQLYTRYHQISRRLGHKTVLWGCSVDPEFLEHEDLLRDLKTFDQIIVRESLSDEAMKKKGLKNTILCPDPAFTLPCADSPIAFPPKDTVGINISPMALDYGSEHSKILENYQHLIQYILKNTTFQVALLPHVVWSQNDDRDVLYKLKQAFERENRVFLVEDMDCTQLKAYISKLRFLVCARTHASIAAYSTGVPVLVTGYSVKAKGIAKDIFGTESHYVVPVKEMIDEMQLTHAFRWIMEHENFIREYLRLAMPNYINRAQSAAQALMKLTVE